VQAQLGVGLEQLDLADGAAIRRDPRLVIEEGAFGKGLGLDAALDAATEAGARRVVLDLGGQVALVADDEPLLVALAHPRERERPLLSVRIDRGSLATSGNSERGFTIDGVRHGHILDPRSGRPAPDFGSLSVWATDAATADALSTALYVLGPREAMVWADARAGVEALALVVTPDGVHALASAGLRDRIEKLEGDLDLRFSTPSPPAGTSRDN
jgi:thiamine biosynthesis lipoprotein